MKTKLLGKRFLIISIVCISVLLISSVILNKVYVTPYIVPAESKYEPSALDRKITEDGYAYYILKDDSNNSYYATITQYNGDDSKAAIPATIENISVKVISRSSFFEKNNVSEIIVPNTIEVIEPCAFEKCKSLSSVTLYNDKVIIDSEAFDKGADIIIIAHKGSTGEKFANDHKLTFKELS